MLIALCHQVGKYPVVYGILHRVASNAPSVLFLDTGLWCPKCRSSGSEDVHYFILPHACWCSSVVMLVEIGGACRIASGISNYLKSWRTYGSVSPGGTYVPFRTSCAA